MGKKTKIFEIRINRRIQLIRMTEKKTKNSTYSKNRKENKEFDLFKRQKRKQGIRPIQRTEKKTDMY